MTERVQESIQDVRSSHKHMSWSANYEQLIKDRVVKSPSFDVDDQRYFLKLQISVESIKLKLFRIGLSENRNVVWWAGLKRGDGSYHHVIKKGHLDLKKECKLWTKVKNLGSFISWKLEKSHLVTDGRITFFFRMNVKQTQTGKTCTHDVAAMRVRGEGSIQEGMCPSHKSVFWHIGLRFVQENDRKVCSPVFYIGKQSYLLEFKRSQKGTEFNLFRMGPSVRGLVLCWAGLFNARFSHASHYGVFPLQQECELWTAVNNLGSFSAADILEADRSRDWRITFFLLIKLGSSACNHGVDEVLYPLRDNTMRGEVLISHENAEWCVPHLNKLLTSKQPFKFTSQAFDMGSQRFKLELSSLDSSRWVNVILHSMGPSVAGPSRFVRWWIKLVRGDGTFDRVKGELDLKEQSMVWTQRNLHRTTRCAIYSRSYGFPFHIYTISSKKPDCVSVVFAAKSTQDAVKMPEDGVVTILEDKCPSHTHVEWYIDNAVRQKDFTSPEFVIGRQRYRLKFTFMSDGLTDKIPVNLHLISREPHIADSSQPVRWGAGVKRSDKSLNYDNGFGRLDLKEECDVWTQKLLHTNLDLARDFRRSVENFTIFFFMDNGTKFSTSTDCTYDFITTQPEFDGYIHQDLCSHHQHIEWMSGEFLDLLRNRNDRIMSPLFCIGAQNCMLELKADDFALLELNLYTRGPPRRPSRSVRWWAGFKRADGTSLSCSTSGILDPGDLCEMFTRRCLLSVHKDEIKQERLVTNKFTTIFFRMNLEQAETGEEMCQHSAIETFPARSKTVRKVECALNKQFETLLRPPETVIGNWWTRKSPEFAVGTQRFYFELSCTLHPGCPLLSLRLYSRGPAHTGRPPSARWWAGLKREDRTFKREDRTYYHRNLSGELDLKEACTLWTLRGTQFFVHSKFTEDMLSTIGQEYTAFFRLDEEKQDSNAAVEYIPGIVEISPTWGFGKIQKEECDSYTQVKWTALYDPLEGKYWNIVSPEFTIGSQLYLLELSQDLNADNSIVLCLYRWGSSATRPSGLVKWWAGLERGNGTYHHRNQRGELDLTLDCELWTQIYLHRVCRNKLERELLTPDDHVTVFFRLSKKQDSEVFIHSSDVAQQNFKRLRRDDDSDLIFKVKGKELKVNKTVFQDRFPVFKAMFHHDTAEKRTGVVSIEDIEPDVFEEFLYYVSTGFVRKLTANNVHAALYIVADKYLIDDLKAQCLQCLGDTLSISSFFDVVTLALNYREDDLLKEAINFFSQNQNIAKTDRWQEFHKCNPEAINELRMRALLPL